MYTTVRARYEGYLQAMKDAGLEVYDDLVFSPDKDMKDFSGGGLQIGTEGIKALLDRVPGMTAVFTTEDMISRSVVGWLYQHGIKVPDQVSVMGFDDYPETAWLCPPLTTICVPYKEIGYEGARQVHRLFRGLDVLITESVLEKISGELVIRKSTSPIVG